ncbi:hypothetical protein SP15_115 [Bacillus phage SP-15]|uniref:Uncharacterized protein n=1 Tax=Bacillus phage SP-15 TaxID=1792032 RepID=A0A127AWF4_9CAUD|nr:hypothetical protein SP15_115 [Bacillus phage SP-15]AMM44913.1 hypothetical protein SP15_115 [Bacillus phage SP-15]
MSQSIFDLNQYLRRFMTPTLVDRYERRCSDIVDKYGGLAPTKDTINSMFSELNEALVKLANEFEDFKKEVESAGDRND